MLSTAYQRKSLCSHRGIVVLTTHRLKAISVKKPYNQLEAVHGIYVHVVQTNDAIKFYVGQSRDLASRIRSHGYPNAKKNLHYKTITNSMTGKRINFYIVAARTQLIAIPTPIDDMYLSILETWVAIIFQSCPSKILAPWMDAAHLSPHHYLNSQFPLTRGIDSTRLHESV